MVNVNKEKNYYKIINNLHYKKYALYYIKFYKKIINPIHIYVLYMCLTYVCIEAKNIENY